MSKPSPSPPVSCVFETSLWSMRMFCASTARCRRSPSAGCLPCSRVHGQNEVAGAATDVVSMRARRRRSSRCCRRASDFRCCPRSAGLGPYAFGYCEFDVTIPVRDTSETVLSRIFSPSKPGLRAEVSAEIPPYCGGCRLSRGCSHGVDGQALDGDAGEATRPPLFWMRSPTGTSFGFVDVVLFVTCRSWIGPVLAFMICTAPVLFAVPPPAIVGFAPDPRRRHDRGPPSRTRRGRAAPCRSCRA